MEECSGSLTLQAVIEPSRSLGIIVPSFISVEPEAQEGRLSGLTGVCVCVSLYLQNPSGRRSEFPPFLGWFRSQSPTTFKDKRTHGLMCVVLLGHSYLCAPRRSFLTWSFLILLPSPSFFLSLSYKAVFKKKHSQFCTCCVWTVGFQQTSSWTSMGTVRQSVSTLSLACTWASWKRCRVSLDPGHQPWRVVNWDK